MKDKYNHTEVYYGIMTLLMYTVTILLVSAVSFLKGKSIGYVFANVFVSVICITVILLYLKRVRINQINFTKQLASYGRIINVYWILFVISFMLTFVPSDIRPMFMIGIIMTLISNEYLGILFQIYFSVMITLITADSIEILVFYLLSGIIGCAIAKYFTQKKYILYAIIIIITSNLALSGMLEYLKNGVLTSKYIISSLAGTFGGVIVVLFVLPYVYYKIDNKLRGRLLQISDPNYELIVMLKNYSKDLYEHSMRVAKLSERVAYKLGVDPLLAKTGGYYHKIGKLEGKDYVNCGVEIAKSYSFPEEVIDIIKQHTGRHQCPQTIEAAVVMLSDTIISAFEYLDDKQNELMYDKDIVIDQVIDTKLDKDMLDESGLSLKMFRDIKKCFKQEENIYDI
jgi:putative nucleotidyltransferase with HDIG domain